MLGWFRRLSRDRFARRMMARIAASGGPNDYSYDAQSFMLKRPDGFANLSNVYQAYCQAKGPQREVLLNNFISAFAAGQRLQSLSFDEARGKIIAVVRERAMFTSAGLVWAVESRAAAPERPKSAFAPLSEWFARAVVVDFPGYVTVITESQLKEWGITFDEAFEIGLENLRAVSAPAFREESGVFIGTWNDDYDSSRVLLPELLDDLPLRGDPVITLPNRLTMLVAGSDDPEGLRSMLARAETLVRSQAKPQNSAPLRLRDGEIIDFDVAEGSPVFHEVQRNRRLAALLTYDDQKVQLERLYAANQKDLFVANYTLTQATDGKYASYCVWSKGVPTLLPTTDVVMFFDESQPEAQRFVARGSWENVKAIAGDLMLDTQMFPARNYVSKFPSAEQLAALGRDEQR